MLHNQFCRVALSETYLRAHMAAARLHIIGRLFAQLAVFLETSWKYFKKVWDQREINLTYSAPKICHSLLELKAQSETRWSFSNVRLFHSSTELDRNGTPHTDVFFPSACVYLLFSDSPTQSAALAARRHHPCPGRSTADGVGWSESVDNPPQESAPPLVQKTRLGSVKVAVRFLRNKQVAFSSICMFHLLFCVSQPTWLGSTSWQRNQSRLTMRRIVI